MRTNGTHPPIEQKRAPSSVLDDGLQIARLMLRFYPELIALAFRDADALPGIDVTFDLENPFVQQVLARLAQDVQRVADTTKTQIADLVGQQAAEGWSSEQLGREIRKLGFTESRQRALTIARTESAAGYTGGQLAAFRTSGVVSQTEWLVGGDACPICLDLSAQRRDLSDEYAPGIVGPPAHPNCVCTLLPVIE